MPLAARSVTPVDIAQNRIPPGLKGDELECVANGTMANLMRQMSSLGLHAVQIFGDIQKEVLAQDRRIERIHDRLSRLQENLANQQESFPPPQNNGALDGRRKAFKSAMIIDQHTLDRSTLPPAMLELYNKCEDPPNLDLLNPYRDDSKSALKLYTNPDYFFDLWKEEMLKEDPSIETKRMARAAKSPERNGSPTKKRKQRTSTSATRHGAPVQSNVVLGHYQQQRMQQQNEQFMHFPSEYQAPELLRNNNIAYEKENHNDMPPPPGMSMPTSVQPTRIAPGRPSAAAQQHQHSRDMVSNFQGLNLTHSNDLGLIDEDDDELPPPPPPLSDHHTNILPNLNSPSAYSSTSTMPLMTALAGSPMKLIEAPAAIPPSNDNDILPPPPSTLSSSMGSAPPPPPPPPPIASMSLMTSSTLIQATSFGGSNTAPSIGNDMAVKEGGGLNVQRGNLLAEIQAGMKLRKTQIQKEKEEEAAAVKKNDVAAILRQRMKKVTTSISDDEEDDDDDGDWE